jgi:HPt (histidine-containing phosphotransfer) domain-containing protein
MFLSWYALCFERTRGPPAESAKEETPPGDGGGCGVSAPGPLDLEALAQLRALPGARGASLADDAIDAFQREFPARLRALGQSVAQADWRTAEHGAQALRGIAATLGAREVLRLSGELAENLSRGSTDQASALLAELAAAGSAAMEALELQRS